MWVVKSANLKSEITFGKCKITYVQTTSCNAENLYLNLMFTESPPGPGDAIKLLYSYSVDAHVYLKKKSVQINVTSKAKYLVATSSWCVFYVCTCTVIQRLRLFDNNAPGRAIISIFIKGRYKCSPKYHLS